MNKKISNVIKTTKGFLGKHSPEILTGIGITGMITTTVLAVKATPKALNLIVDKQEELGYAYDEKLPTVEVIKAAWKPYIPAAALCVASISCLVGASTVNYKRNTALATAYAISERTLIRYRDKVIDTIGEKREKEVREKISQDEINNKPISNSQVIVTTKGNVLCMDSLSGRYFRSDIDHIKKIMNELNRQINCQEYISLNEFYYELGLEPIKSGSYMGWNVYSGLIDISFDACIAENDEPCIVINHEIPPKYDFDKLM